MEQSEALEILKSGRNCFLTGKAGTGKTYVMKQFVEFLEAEMKTPIIVAPTGIAAINAGGATIHSTFKMFGNYLMKRMPNHQSVEWKYVDVIIIDEISMVGPDYLDYIDFLLRRETWYQEPFGGIQIVLVGDPMQLPPVYVGTDERSKMEIADLTKKYGTLTFTSAESYKDFESLDLTTIYRQHDNDFIDILNAVRGGDMSVIDKLKRGKWDANSVHLKPFNNMVDKHNDSEFHKLLGTAQTYTGTVVGQFNLKNCLTPQLLDLKVGARVMITKNLKEGLVNGDLGFVAKMNPTSVIFKSDRFGEDIEIGFETWKEIVYEGGGEEVKGTFTQIPMKLAWAITIHKSQGLSLENVCFTYAKGMSKELVYVGLSRCTNMDSLYVHHA